MGRREDEDGSRVEIAQERRNRAGEGVKPSNESPIKATYTLDGKGFKHAAIFGSGDSKWFADCPTGYALGNELGPYDSSSTEDEFRPPLGTLCWSKSGNS